MEEGDNGEAFLMAWRQASMTSSAPPPAQLVELNCRVKTLYPPWHKAGKRRANRRHAQGFHPAENAMLKGNLLLVPIIGQCAVVVDDVSHSVPGEMAEPVKDSRISSSFSPSFFHTRTAIPSVAVRASGMLIPCRAIQSISFSHRSQDQYGRVYP